MVLKHASTFGRVSGITILPGINFGHLKFENPESSHALLSSLTHQAEHMMGAGTIDGRTLVYFHTQLQASDLKR